MNSPKTRGAAPVLLYLVIVVAGLLGFQILKPKALHGDSRRADASAAATQAVEAATTKQGSFAAASVVKIGEVNATAPASREKDFIAQEVPVALAQLPAPDPQALLAAERRRVAVMSGELAESQRLYADALQHADRLAQEKNEALIARQRVDAELQRVAAERLGEQHERAVLLTLAVLAMALFLYVKLTHLSPGALAEAVTDIKSGKGGIEALDQVSSRLQQGVIRLLAKFRA